MQRRAERGRRGLNYRSKIGWSYSRTACRALFSPINHAFGEDADLRSHTPNQKCAQTQATAANGAAAVLSSSDATVGQGGVGVNQAGNDGRVAETP